MRTRSYLAAVASAVRPGDVVVDLGTGTGILAIAAARAGARRVYAIEAGGIGAAAAEIFRVNGVHDRITMIQGWSTDVELPEKADLMTSELLGNEPFAEDVLAITADARTRFLKSTGRIIPMRLRLFCVPISLTAGERRRTVFTSERLRVWQRWYGINFSPLLTNSAAFMHRTFVNGWTVRGCARLADPALIYQANFAACEPVPIEGAAEMQVIRSGEITGLLFFFEVDLTAEILLSTDPRRVSRSNHWLCPAWVLNQQLRVRTGAILRLEYRYNPDGSLNSCEIYPL